MKDEAKRINDLLRRVEGPGVGYPEAVDFATHDSESKSGGASTTADAAFRDVDGREVGMDTGQGERPEDALRRGALANRPTVRVGRSSPLAAPGRHNRMSEHQAANLLHNHYRRTLLNRDFAAASLFMSLARTDANLRRETGDPGQNRAAEAISEEARDDVGNAAAASYDDDGNPMRNADERADDAVSVRSSGTGRASGHAGSGYTVVAETPAEAAVIKSMAAWAGSVIGADDKFSDASTFVTPDNLPPEEEISRALEAARPPAFDRSRAMARRPRTIAFLAAEGTEDVAARLAGQLDRNTFIATGGNVQLDAALAEQGDRHPRLGERPPHDPENRPDAAMAAVDAADRVVFTGDVESGDHIDSGEPAAHGAARAAASGKLARVFDENMRRMNVQSAGSEARRAHPEAEKREPAAPGPRPVNGSPAVAVLADRGAEATAAELATNLGRNVTIATGGNPDLENALDEAGDRHPRMKEVPGENFKDAAKSAEKTANNADATIFVGNPEARSPALAGAAKAARSGTLVAAFDHKGERLDRDTTADLAKENHPTPAEMKRRESRAHFDVPAASPEGRLGLSMVRGMTREAIDRLARTDHTLNEIADKAGTEAGRAELYRDHRVSANATAAFADERRVASARESFGRIISHVRERNEKLGAIDERTGQVRTDGETPRLAVVGPENFPKGLRDAPNRPNVLFVEGKDPEGIARLSGSVSLVGDHVRDQLAPMASRAHDLMRNIDEGGGTILRTESHATPDAVPGNPSVLFLSSGHDHVDRKSSLEFGDMESSKASSGAIRSASGVSGEWVTAAERDGGSISLFHREEGGSFSRHRSLRLSREARDAAAAPPRDGVYEFSHVDRATLGRATNPEEPIHGAVALASQPHAMLRDRIRVGEDRDGEGLSKAVSGAAHDGRIGFASANVLPPAGTGTDAAASAAREAGTTGGGGRPEHEPNGAHAEASRATVNALENERGRPVALREAAGELENRGDEEIRINPGDVRTTRVTARSDTEAALALNASLARSGRDRGDVVLLDGGSTERDPSRFERVEREATRIRERLETEAQSRETEVVQRDAVKTRQGVKETGGWVVSEMPPREVDSHYSSAIKDHVPHESTPNDATRARASEMAARTADATIFTQLHKDSPVRNAVSEAAERGPHQFVLQPEEHYASLPEVAGNVTMSSRRGRDAATGVGLGAGRADSVTARHGEDGRIATPVKPEQGHEIGKRLAGRSRPHARETPDPEENWTRAGGGAPAHIERKDVDGSGRPDAADAARSADRLRRRSSRRGREQEA